MAYIINGREPENLYRRFEDIASLPHGSGNEKALADYIVKFAEDLGLYVVRDERNNVFVRRGASPGYKDHPPVLIQGHIDMVCEADPDVKIDWEHEGVKLRLDGDMLSASGTTLGADDGVAVAIMLALLEDKGLCAPTIECLFTTEEETGLTGASSFDYSNLTSRRMINLDTGGEVIIVSCAGGMRTLISSTAKMESYKGTVMTVSVDRLAGGHSGADIHLGRGNANLIALRLAKAAGGQLVSIHGGSKDNAIPSRCRISFACEDADAAKKAVFECEKKIREELTEADAGMKINVSAEEFEGRIPCRDFTDRLLSFTSDVPTGVISMCEAIDMVETSQNYAIIDLDEDGRFALHLSARSSVDETLDKMEREIGALAAKYGFRAETGSRYNGWSYEPNSPIRDAYIEVYRETAGHDIPVMGIHAGLECGIIKRAVPDMDIIATGAVTLGEHTTREALDLNSFALVYETVKKLCSRL